MDTKVAIDYLNRKKYVRVTKRLREAVATVAAQIERRMFEAETDDITYPYIHFFLNSDNMFAYTTDPEEAWSPLTKECPEDIIIAFATHCADIMEALNDKIDIEWGYEAKE